MAAEAQSAAQQQQRGWFKRAFASFTMLLILGASFPSGATSLAEREFAAAVKSYQAGRTSEAFGQFQELANRGDVDAARIALFMTMYGPLLYGKHWDALTQDTAYWNTLVRNSGTSGRPAPAFQPLTYAKKKPRQLSVKNAAPLRAVSMAADQAPPHFPTAGSRRHVNSNQ